MNEATVLLIIATLTLSLMSAGLSLLIPQRLTWLVPIVASVLLLASAICSFILFSSSQSSTPDFRISWFQMGNGQMQIALSTHPTVLILLLVVSGVSFLVHVFSIGYMVDDAAVKRYFAFLGLFTFAMQALVVSGNLLQLFFFWELVGLCSYFLIGHWRHKDAAATAATKAFVMNRLGDAGLLIGLAIIWVNTNTLHIEELASAEWSNPFWKSVACFCLFLGVTGKSAQFPLLTWLPDAMEGPTPVSALIHAATMVAAGVFLLVRVHFMITTDVATVIAVVGGITSLYGAWHALNQFDIKKILAYSTLSQLGLMVLAIGAGAWAGAFFHLFTHALFKAALFLGAGAVIHSFHHTNSSFDAQDIRNMGGLRKIIPNTFIAFMISAGALAGLPLFTGFVSKEAMLATMLRNAQSSTEMLPWLWVVLFFVISFATVLYTFRLVKFVFFGEYRSAAIAEPARTPMIMVFPMTLLALGSIWWTASLNPFGGESWVTERIISPQHGPTILVVVSIAWVTIALFAAQLLFRKELPARKSNTNHLDHLYQRALVRPVSQLANTADHIDGRWIDRFLHRVVYLQVGSAFLTAWFDRVFVDGVVNSVAQLLKTSGSLIRRSAKGNLQSYVLWSALALVIFLFWLLK